VGATGYSIACARAEESKRDDRLFDDPFAELFASTGPGVSAMLDFEQHSQKELEDIIAFGAVTQFAFAVRTRFFDDVLLRASDTCPQVVIVAAGLDARAFRLPWPMQTRLFELDMPAVLEFKQNILQSADASPTCRRTVVAADLSDDWRPLLLKAGFDPSVPSAWLAEGLMLYLTSEQAESLLLNVGGLSSAGSQLSFEHGPYADDELLDRVVSTHAIRGSAATWNGGLTDDPAAWLDSHGWDTTSRDIAEVGRVLGREPPPHVAVDLILGTRR
jgi:methyltransferase (TIGR00027 family)